MTKHAGNRSMQRWSWRPKIVLLACILLAGTLHFVHLPESSVWYRVPLAGPVVYSFDPDSPNFARSVVEFPRALNDSPQGRARLMRPLYSGAAWLVYKPLTVFKGLVPPGLARRVHAEIGEANHPALWRGIDPREVVLAWIALVIVSVSLLWVSLLLVQQALLPVFSDPLATLLAASVAFHFVTIRYVYVPHTEPFDLLIPALVLYSATKVWERGRTGWLGASVLGVAFLGKAIGYPALNWLYEHLVRRPWRQGWRRATLLALVIAAPTVVYTVLLAGLRIEPVNHEVVEYRQVVWMADYVREGRAAEIPVRWARGLFTHLRFTVVGFATPLSIIVFLSVFGKARRRCSLPPGLLEHLGLLFVTGALFWMLVGFVNLRLTICHYPAVVVALGCVCVGNSEYPVHWVGVAILGQAVLFVVGAYG